MECPNGEEEVPFDDKYLKIILKILKYLKILNVKNIQKYDLMECPNGEEEVSLNIWFKYLKNIWFNIYKYLI